MVAIEHFGSTSIPPIKAKPILDILVWLRRFEDGIRLVGPMQLIGYNGYDEHLFA